MQSAASRVGCVRVQRPGQELAGAFFVWEELKSVRRSVSSPVLHSGPEIGERAEFRTVAKENRDFGFQPVAVGRGSAEIFDVLKKAFQNLAPVSQHNQAISGISAWPPQPIRPVAAEGNGQTELRPEKINRSRLTVVLPEDGAVFTVGDGDFVLDLGCFLDNFVPPELVGIMLWEGGAHVTVFTARHLDGQPVHVRDELIDGKNGHSERRKNGPANQRQRHD